MAGIMFWAGHASPCIPFTWFFFFKVYPFPSCPTASGRIQFSPRQCTYNNESCRGWGNCGAGLGGQDLRDSRGKGCMQEHSVRNVGSLKWHISHIDRATATEPKATWEGPKGGVGIKDALTPRNIILTESLLTEYKTEKKLMKTYRISKNQIQHKPTFNHNIILPFCLTISLI